MTEQDSNRQRLLERLEKERDELKVKLGLAKLEAREEWQELEEKLQKLRGRLKVLGGEAKDASGDVGAAFDLVAEEIKEGFGRIKKLF